MAVLSGWVTAQKKATNEAVRVTSMMYLDELAGRREQVVATNFSTSIKELEDAVDLMTDEDLSDTAHLNAYQNRMQKLYDLEKFAFVDETGLIYTTKGTRTNIDDYDFDYKNLNQARITYRNVSKKKKSAIIAIPIDGKSLNGHKLVVCFMEKDMQSLLSGLSLQSDTNDTTFCNIYTQDGIALSNQVLGGLSSDDNLMTALKKADYLEGYSYKKVKNDFENKKAGLVSFTYNGIE